MTRELIALYSRLESLSKSLEACDRIDALDDRDAYPTILEAMSFVRAQAERAPEAVPVALPCARCDTPQACRQHEHCFSTGPLPAPAPPAAEVERLRGLLREAIPHVGSFDDASSEALLFRIQAALGEG